MALPKVRSTAPQGRAPCRAKTKIAEGGIR